MSSALPFTFAKTWVVTWTFAATNGPGAAVGADVAELGAELVGGTCVSVGTGAMVGAWTEGEQAATRRTSEAASAPTGVPEARKERRVIECTLRSFAIAGSRPDGPGPVLASPRMEAFELADLLEAQGKGGRLYHEFVRTHDLSVGLYVLPAGGTDPQGPHTEDEVYHVVAGRARITVGDDDRPVQAGSVVFVGADEAHRFHSIDEELVVIVFFGPAEYTHRVDHQTGQPHGAATG
jgi:mannose-6-phosphate isomerase-like protein (cupin superfamily)